MNYGSQREFERGIQEPAPHEIDLLELFATIWRGKGRVLAAAIVAMIAGAYYAYGVATPTYTARASVALENRQEQMIELESVMSGLSGDQATINTESEILRSRRLAQKLVVQQGLTDDPEFNPFIRPSRTYSISGLKERLLGQVPQTPTEKRVLDVTTNNLMSAISVSNVRSSYVFNIQLVTTDPEKSARLANGLADLYIEDQIVLKNEATERAISWLSQRVATLQSELEIAEQKAQDFAAQTTLVNSETLEALGLQVKNVRARIADVRATRDEGAIRIAEMEAARESGETEVMRLAASDSRFDQLADQRTSKAALLIRFDEVLSAIKADHQRAALQLSSLQSGLARLESNFDEQSTDLVKLEQLQREAGAARSLYEFFLTRMKETAVQTGMQQADSRLLSEAIEPNGPSAPRTSLVLVLSGMLGLMGGVGSVLVREMKQDSFRTAEDLAQTTGASVLGQIPSIPEKARKNVLEFFIRNPTSPAAEAIRNLRTSLMLSDLDNPPKVIMTTSSIPGEGKTTNSLALALNFAGLGKKVLLLEGDIRRRVFAEYFDITNKSGFLGVLSGESEFEDVVTHHEGLGIDVLIGVKSDTNAADLFSSERFAEFLSECRDRYDIVVIDTAPVLVVPDSRIIAHHVDAIVFTVKWDATTKVQVTSALRQFEMVGKPVTGLALSQIDPKGMQRYGYGGRYGAYAAYGSDYDQ
ncbi:GumC family protein [Maritimibacter dapengensis]|uniref:non-specific protein-tyrosine kinase n=1 Tax=Maritimibacter dapengensis TaxID=2836868 RepID=A0ABS6T592_9RHOB|nr:polysaccharide biosynthesis tyrosine autokinase [Maritimibacter dapengensis]MBV7380160.1 polysaccharide biosynthesis tyrosine autokinase [Maritimibacter dapengensis]